jgi:4'-phosphopantetheinyl transferase
VKGRSAEHWSVGPDRPSLSKGVLHVWYADLARVPADLGVLSAPERRRARRILDTRRQDSWTRARATIRELLARYTGDGGSQLRFRSSAAGKPALTDCRQASNEHAVRFSVTHSGRHALYAIGLGLAVGVDLEDGAHRRDYTRVERRARRQGVLIDPPDAEDTRDDRFLCQWVRAEAELKCLGRGILGAAGFASARSALWYARLGGLPGAPDAVAGVAALAPPRELRCWSYG